MHAASHIGSDNIEQIKFSDSESVLDRIRYGMTWHKSEAVQTRTDRRITGRRFRGLDEVEELGAAGA
jgi:hypothetical protein